MTLRNEIKEMISRILPYDPLEKEHIDFVENWIDSGEGLFRIAKPDVPNIHLVSYFILFDPVSNEFLLVDHKNAGLWLPPGGHVEPDEHPQEAVKREVREELGIEAEFIAKEPFFVTVTKTVGATAGHTDVSLWYILKGNREDALTFDRDEFHQIGWFSAEDIPYERSDPHLKRFIAKTEKKLITLHSYEVSVTQYAENTADLHPEEDGRKFMQRLSPSANVLDIGCGPGRDAKVFLEYGLNVTGIDFSPKMVEAAKKSAPQGNFFVMDIEQIAFPPESFHGAWANCSLLHVPKQHIPVVLSKIHALLKPQGVLYLSLKQSPIDEAFEKDDRYGGLEKFWSYFEQEELAFLLNNGGFSIIDAGIAHKNAEYQTHSMIKILAKKLW